MTDEELNRKFDRLANHLEALTESVDRMEVNIERMGDLQAQDRIRHDEAQMRADQRVARLERLFGLLLRAGQRERKDLREKIHLLLDAQTRTENTLARMAEAQTEMMRAITKTDQRIDAIEGNGGPSR